MMSFYGVHNFGTLSKPTGKVGTNDRVRPLNLVVHRLSKIMQKPGTLGRNRIEPQFGSHDAT